MVHNKDIENPMHLAGDFILLPNQVLQRCMLCGELLRCDTNRQETIKAGSWVKKVKGKFVSFRTVNFLSFERKDLPKSCCITYE